MRHLKTYESYNIKDIKIGDKVLLDIFVENDIDDDYTVKMWCTIDEIEFRGHVDLIGIIEDGGDNYFEMKDILYHVPIEDWDEEIMIDSGDLGLL